MPEPDLPKYPWPQDPSATILTTAPCLPTGRPPRNFFDSSWLSLDRPGWLGLRGRESLFSPYSPSVVARRLQHVDFTAQTRLEFDPRRFQEMAGLVCLYDTMNFLSLHVGWSDEHQTRVLDLMRSDNGKREEFPAHRVVLPPFSGTEPSGRPPAGPRPATSS